MRRSVLLFVVLVVAVMGLSWSMATTLMHAELPAPLTQAIPLLAQNAPQQNVQAFEQGQLADPTLDSALAVYKPALRSPFLADLAQHANAPRYEVDLVLDVDKRQISGQQTVRYTNQTQQPLSDLVLRLYPNTHYMGGQMTLGQVQVGPMPSAWSWLLPDQSAAQVSLLKRIAPGEVITLSVSFTLSVPNRPRGAGYLTFGLFDELWALPNAFVMVAPRQDDRWQVDPAPNFGDIVFAEMALYRVSLRAPSTYKVVATGVCQTDGTAPGVTPSATTSCTSGPVRDFALHLSESYASATTTVNSIIGEPVQLSSYFLPQHRVAGERALNIATNALNSYENRFGPYPYAELKLFATTTSAGGIEYPNLAGVLHSFYAANDDYFEWLVAHEVAHQWWYNLVGSNPINEPWLDEALTQFSALLYIEDRYGVAVAQTYRERYFTARFSQERRRRGDRRVGQATSSFPRGAYFPIVYGKGPLFFDAVRSRSDEARFAAWLRAYYERHRYGTARAVLLRPSQEIEFKK